MYGSSLNRILAPFLKSDVAITNILSECRLKTVPLSIEKGVKKAIYSLKIEVIEPFRDIDILPRATFSLFKKDTYDIQALIKPYPRYFYNTFQSHSYAKKR